MSSVAETSGVLIPGDFKSEEYQDPRRREPRTPCDKIVQIQSMIGDEKGEFIDVQLVDCSTRGLGLIVPRPMEWGEQFIAKLQLEKALLLIYEARYSRDLGGNMFRVGAEFVGFAEANGSMDSKEILGEVLKSHAAKHDLPPAQ
jgi:hypothetical protein